MAQYTQQPTDRTSFNPMAHSQISNQPQIHERSSRYSGISGQQQPDQSSRSHKPSDNVAEVAQGLKELQEKINNALKRSSSSTPIRPNPNVSAVPSVPSFKPVQTEIEPEKSQRLYESYYEARSAASSNQPSQPATAKYAPSDMKASTASTASFSTSQPYSSRFYLGASQNSSNMAEQERLMNSIKSYQVKTLNSLSSSRSIQSSQTYTQATPVKKANQTLGSSTILSSASFVPIHGFQPSFDTQQLEHVISRIMTNQSFNGTRQESFVTNQDSYLMTRVNESNVTQDKIRRTPQQSRPAKPSQSLSHINPRKPTTSQQTKKPKDPKSSCCGEIELDGDSMILEFIKENDQLFLEDDGEERPAKRARAVEEDKPQPKKLSKRQEILNSKRQLKKK